MVTHSGETQVAALATWCRTLLRYMSTILEPSFVSGFEQAVAHAERARDARGLRMAKRDLLEWAQDLDSGQQQKLDEMLREQCGEGLDYARWESTVQRVLKRKQLKSENEYRILRNWFDVQNERGALNQDERERIDSILSDFDTKKS